jgi:hypothetical protein
VGCKLSSTIARELRRGGGGSIGDVSKSAVSNLVNAFYMQKV